MREQNPLDWYEENVCSKCDLPNKTCGEARWLKIECELAYIAKKLTEAKP